MREIRIIRLADIDSHFCKKTQGSAVNDHSVSDKGKYTVISNFLQDPDFFRSIGLVLWRE
jgi:hypothetical protein